MIRLFKYDKCSEFTDFPNDLFRRTDIPLTFKHSEDRVTIGSKDYRLSSSLYIQGCGSPSNSVESSLFIKFKTNIKLALQNLFSC